MDERNPPEISFQNRTIVVTNHAIERFKERWRYVDPISQPKDYVRTMGRLLQKAQRSTLTDAQRVIRLINNEFQEAEYWSSGRWRFVIAKDRASDTLLLKTAELADR